MARMYPSNLDGYQSDDPDAPMFIPHGERRVFELLRAGLAEAEWEVFWDVRFWLDADCTRQRQIDFIVAHPAWGLLMIEVKGGRYEYVPQQGGWCSVKSGQYRRDKHGSAWKQLDSAFWRFFDERRGVSKLTFCFGQAVILPHCTLVKVNGSLPQEADGPITAVRDDCVSPEVLRGWITNRLKAIRRAFPNVGAGSEFAASVERFLARELRPRVESVVPLAAVIRQVEADEKRLTIEQLTILRQLRKHSRGLVQGFAGTGKTLIATKIALEAMNGEGHAKEADKRVALLTFNENPAAQFSDVLAQAGVQATHFHAFCDQLCSRFDFGPLPADKSMAAEMRIKNLQSLAQGGHIEPYDTIIVDEGQDFRPEWLALIEKLLLKPKLGRLFVMNDPQQDIYGVGPYLNDHFGQQTFYLYTNCRNVKRLVSRLKATYPELSAMDSPSEMPEGCDVQSVHFESPEQAFGKLESLIRELMDPETHAIRAEQIVLLSPRSRQSTCLADRKTIAGRSLRSFGERISAKGPGAVRFETVHSFKGCESDVVVLHDVESGYWTSELLYVALSRARFGLYCVAPVGWDIAKAVGTLPA